MNHARFGWSIVTAAAVVAAVAGCSSSSGNSTGAGAGGLPSNIAAAASNLPAAASSALAAITKGGGPLDVSKMCAAVPQSDIQKLFKDTAPKVTDNPGECDWGGGGITVDIYTNDASKQYYSNGGIAVGSATPLPGVGDEALWAEPVPNHTVPDLAAHKGTTTCTITPGLDVDQTTMAYSGSSPIFTVTDASALQYAQAEGQICQDIFGAG